ncbi:acyl-CoA thioesterase [Candidatus Poribacteria bacterium]|nr:acyl-CoA thioesterase [Candidatus Poribacteria bacterium]
MQETPALPASNFHDHLIRIVYRDTDQMGFVYYANYLVFMEIGRVELLRARAWSYRAMEEEGFRIPVLHAECDYLRPARYDDLLRVRTTLVEATRLRLSFQYEIHCDERRELIATGATRHAFMNTQGKPQRVTESVVERLKALPAPSKPGC